MFEGELENGQNCEVVIDDENPAAGGRRRGQKM